MQIKELSILDAFKALNEIEDEQVVTPKIRRKISESKFNIRDNKEMDEAREFLEDSDEEKETELEVVDVDADSLDHIKHNSEYIGQYILQCKACNTLRYMDKEDLEEDPEEPNVFNKETECPHCHAMNSGYTIIGQVGAVKEDELPVEEEPEVEEPKEEEKPIEEEPKEEEPEDLTFDDVEEEQPEQPEEENANEEEDLLSADDYDKTNESLEEEIVDEAKKDEEAPIDPDYEKAGVHDMIADLVKDEVEAIQGYNDVKQEVSDSHVEHKDDIIDAIDHIVPEEEEHIDELNRVANTIAFNKEDLEDEKEEVKEEEVVELDPEEEYHDEEEPSGDETDAEDDTVDMESTLGDNYNEDEVDYDDTEEYVEPEEKKEELESEEEVEESCKKRPLNENLDLSTLDQFFNKCSNPESIGEVVLMLNDEEVCRCSFEDMYPLNKHFDKIGLVNFDLEGSYDEEPLTINVRPSYYEDSTLEEFLKPYVGSQVISLYDEDSNYICSGSKDEIENMIRNDEYGRSYDVVSFDAPKYIIINIECEDPNIIRDCKFLSQYTEEPIENDSREGLEDNEVELLDNIIESNNLSKSRLNKKGSIEYYIREDLVNKENLDELFTEYVVPVCDEQLVKDFKAVTGYKTPIDEANEKYTYSHALKEDKYLSRMKKKLNLKEEPDPKQVEIDDLKAQIEILQTKLMAYDAVEGNYGELTPEEEDSRREIENELDVKEHALRELEFDTDEFDRSVNECFEEEGCCNTNYHTNDGCFDDAGNICLNGCLNDVDGNERVICFILRPREDGDYEVTNNLNQDQFVLECRK